MERALKSGHYNLVVKDLAIRRARKKTPNNRSLTYCKSIIEQEQNTCNYLYINHLGAPAASKVPVHKRWIETIVFCRRFFFNHFF
jgi:hypothetical protein